MPNPPDLANILEELKDEALTDSKTKSPEQEEELLSELERK